MASKSKSTKKTTKPKLSKRANKALDKVAKHGLNNVRPAADDEIPAFLRSQHNPSSCDCKTSAACDAKTQGAEAAPMTATEVKEREAKRKERWDALVGGMVNDLVQAKKRQEQGLFFGFLLDHINIVVMGHMLTYIAIALNFAAKYQVGVAYGVLGLAFAYFAVLQRRKNNEKFSGFLVWLSQVAVIASYAGWVLTTIFAK